MKRELTIDNRVINDDSRCYVIAEAGHNHQGNIEQARTLFRRAKECGANAVKLQKRHNRSLYIDAMYDSPYTHENSFGPTYGLHREALEFDREEYEELKRYAAEIGITMFATAFDLPSADFLAGLDMPAYKIASGDLKNTPLMKHVARIGKPILVSTGGGTIDDVQRAYDTIMPINTQLCLMQCTASYPVDAADMNIRVVTTFREQYPDIVIGMSDHQSGIAMAMVAYTLGARIIEKHFTLNRAMRGTDHAFSLEPVGLEKLVRDLNRAHVAMGDGIKRPLPCEEKPLFKMGKKLVASHDLPAGRRLAETDIAFKSPNDGLPPFEIDRVIGRTLKRSLARDENISFADLTDI